MKIIKKIFTKKNLLIIAASAICLCLALLISVMGINTYMVNSTDDNIISENTASELKDIDCILVLGCGVKPGGTPSTMLRDRLICGIELYNSGASGKLLMSGDHGQADYNEVGTMKSYAIDNNVPSDNIFMDHAGFSTYESMYRAKEVFEAEKIIIVTQGYHLPRAIYIAESLGLEAYGVASDYHNYGGQISRDIREVLARCKDFVTSIFKPLPTYLGETMPISGNGDITNDY